MSKSKFKVNLNSNESIKMKRNLEPSGKGQRLMTSEIKRLSDPYVPFQDGTLKDTSCVVTDKEIKYNAPYARYQWHGVSKNGNPLNYQGAPMRGREWTRRMMSDRGKDVIEAVTKVTGGRTK